MSVGIVVVEQLSSAVRSVFLGCELKEAGVRRKRGCPAENFMGPPNEMGLFERLEDCGSWLGTAGLCMGFSTQSVGWLQPTRMVENGIPRNNGNYGKKKRKSSDFRDYIKQNVRACMISN